MADIRNVLRFSAVLGFATLAAALVASGVRAASSGVPAGVPIPVDLTAQVTSLTAHVGDTFAFKTTKDETLGDLKVPSGTPGSGRIAAVQAGHDNVRGSVALQADKLQLSTGDIVWVNIDPSKPPTGHLSDKHTKFYILPIPIGIVPGTVTTVSGNMVLDPGTAFRVVTIAPRKAPAPLVTATPSPPPSPAPQPPAPSPAAH